MQRKYLNFYLLHGTWNHCKVMQCASHISSHCQWRCQKYKCLFNLSLSTLFSITRRLIVDFLVVSFSSLFRVTPVYHGRRTSITPFCVCCTKSCNVGNLLFRIKLVRDFLDFSKHAYIQYPAYYLSQSTILSLLYLFTNLYFWHSINK